MESLLDVSVDILSTLKLLITLPRSVTQISRCHNVPYIFDTGAIFKTWVFQLYEKLKRTGGGRAWEMEGRRQGGGKDEGKERAKEGGEERRWQIEREGERKGFTVRETNVRVEGGGRAEGRLCGRKKIGDGVKERDGKWGSRTERARKRRPFIAFTHSNNMALCHNNTGW